MKVLLRDKNGNCHPVEDILLAVQSKVLRSCFKYSDSSEVIDLPLVEGDILKKIIAWLHCPQPETLDLEKAAGFFVCDLLVASEFLDISLLSQQIITWMVKMFSPGNILDLWIFSKRFLITRLEVVCWQFLMKNIDDLKTRQLQALDREDLLSLLTSDDLRMNEESVWELVEKLTGPNDDGTLLKECVRYGLLEESFLIERVLKSSTFQRYFPSTLPTESLSERKPRTPNNLVFFFGGLRPGQQQPSPSMTVLDPSTGIWGQLPISFAAGLAYSGAVLDQSTVYIAGGWRIAHGSTDSLIKLDLQDLSLTHLSRFRVPRDSHGLTKIGQELFVVGGVSEEEEDLKTIERYSIPRNQWYTYEEEMQERRSYAGVAAVDGKIYVVGGYDGYSADPAIHHRSMEIFDPQSGTWKSGKKMKKRRSDVQAAVKDGKIYVVGGDIDGEVLRCGEVYDPESNSWSDLPEMLVPRSLYTIFVAEGRLVVAGGYTGFGLTETVEYLDEKIMKWKFAKGNLVDARSAMSSVSVPVDNLSDETLKKFRDLCS